MGIPGITPERMSWQTRLLFRFLKVRDGAVPAPLSLYAWRPSILFSFLRLGRAIRKNGALAEREKRLAMYWAAQQVECPLWVDLTSKLAREAGINEAEIGELHRYRESALFSVTEKDVLAFAEAVTATPARVPPELLGRLQSRFSTPQLVELAAAIAIQNFSARFNRALDIR